MRRFAVVFALTLSVGALVVAPGSPVAQATTLPTVTIGSVSVVEGDSGSAVVNVPVDLSGPPVGKTTVQYWIHGGTASPGSDFAGTAGLLTFAVGGPVSKFISVTVYGDTVVEPDETVDVSLVLANNATLANSLGTVTIVDDDSDPNVGLQASIGNLSVYASTSGVHYAELPVTLSRPATSTVKVNYSISCSDAESGVDYVLQNTGSITFHAGDQTKQLEFQILPNQTDDEVKTILGSIAVSAGPAALDDSSGEATIVDGDGGTSSGGSGGDLPPLAVGDLERESVSSQGDAAQSPEPSVCGSGGIGSFAPSISADGRYVAFISDAENLVPDDNDNESDVFVRDRLTGAVERVNVASDGTEQAPYFGGAPYSIAWGAAISPDGRYVTFYDRNAIGTYSGNQYFIHDRQTGTTVPLLSDLNGNPADLETGGNDAMLLSSDDRYVAFTSCGDNSASGSTPLVATDLDPPQVLDSENSGWFDCDVFRYDRTTGAYTLVSNPPDGSPSDGRGAAMSANGRYVAFWSTNTDYVPGDTNNCSDLFVRDMQTGTVERVNVTTAGAQSLALDDGECGYNGYFVALSDDGRYVAFSTSSWNLQGRPDGSGVPGQYGIHMYVRDRVAGTTTMVDPGGSVTALWPAFSGDGAYLAYWCGACGVNSGFVIDELATGDTIRAAELANGIQGDAGDLNIEATARSFSADGSYFVFSTGASNLVADDDNNVADVFVKRVH